ncbi:MAG: Ig-like domain-containing protein [Acutalibacteraceae bacterium]
MSLKEKQKSSGSVRKRYAKRPTDRTKHTSKKRIVLALSSVALTAVSITAFAFSPVTQVSASRLSVLSSDSFMCDVQESELSKLISSNDKRVTASALSLKAKGKDADADSAIKPTRLTLSKSNKTFKSLKETLMLTASLNKHGVPEDYKWESSDKKIAAVDETGKVTPKKNGKVTITCTELNSGATAKCVITVDAALVNSLKLSKSKLTLTPNETKTITAKVSSDKNANKKLKWSSSDKTVATVDSKGKVTAVSVGEAVITCSTTDGTRIKKECKITVKDKINLTGITLNYIDIQFCGLGNTEQLELLEFSPSNATDKSLKWESTDESVATVDENGVVSPVDNGECKIIATAKDGSGVTATCPVTVSGVVDYVEVATNYEVVIPDSVDVNETANSIVEEAEKYVGWLPYVWGGTDLTSGVDCSGFICAVYQKFGINLWGIRTDLIYAGREVSLEEARAGDIIVYHGHVAIYDGNGGKIHAPTEGYMVTHDYGIGDYRSIRRVIE